MTLVTLTAGTNGTNIMKISVSGRDWKNVSGLTGGTGENCPGSGMNGIENKNIVRDCEGQRFSWCDRE